MTETEPTNPPAECPDACTEHHTYGPDCAATAADYDPNAGMRDRYAEALQGVVRRLNHSDDGSYAPGNETIWQEQADAVLAVRDVYLNNVRRISKQQTTQLAELYMTTKKRAADDFAASRESERQLQQQIDAQAKEIDRLRDELDEARMWARHGYELGQINCTWTDHGVAPAWLTDGWPTHFPSPDQPEEQP